jgi:hypothetical protein
MSEKEKKLYRVLKPIAWGGRREVGEILELSEEEAKNLGDEYVAPEPAPATAGAEPARVQVEGEAAVKPKIKNKK